MRVRLTGTWFKTNSLRSHLDAANVEILFVLLAVCSAIGLPWPPHRRVVDVDFRRERRRVQVRHEVFGLRGRRVIESPLALVHL